MRRALTNGLHLAVLSTFALAEPLLDILGRNPEFFAVRRSTSSEIVLFALGLTLLPPAALLTVELLVGVVSRAAAQALHLVFIAGLVAIVVLHAITNGDASSGVAAIVVAATAGAMGALLYRRARPVGSFLTILAPAPLVFLLLFIFNSEISKLVFVDTPRANAAQVTSKTPVVLIVFDEFSTVSLMNRNGRIDSQRYPNFGALASRSTWFRSATTVHWLSEIAVPTVLSGILPKGHPLPIYADHPHNVFTLLGKRYRPRAVESLSNLCPKSLCRETAGSSPQAIADTPGSLASDAGIVYLHLVLPEPYAKRIPAISDTWGNFGKTEARQEVAHASEAQPLRPCARNVCRFVSLITADRRPALYVLHSLLPHVPYLYLPSGRRYAVEAPLLRGTRAGYWRQDWPALQSYQRYLLQVEYTDRALGFILQRLRTTGEYDRALVIVTADHGVSFRHGQPRRLPTSGNLEDIAFVPLFVKLPHERKPHISDSFARTIDVVPTIARVLGISIPWHVDGRPLVGRRLRADGTVSVLIGKGRQAAAQLSDLRARRAHALVDQLDAFGTTPSDLYRIGPHVGLVGRALSALRVRRSETTAIALDGSPLLDVVDTHSDLLPTYLQGHLTGKGGRGGLDLAVAVNGEIAAVTRTFEQDGETRFGAMVPEKVMHDGHNDVAVFIVRRNGGGLSLEELRGSSATTALRERGGGELIESSAEGVIRVDPRALRGAVQVSTGANFVFTGWASDRQLKSPAKTLIVFADGQQVFASRATLLQPHRVLGQRARAWKKRLGFEFELPRALLPDPGDGDRVRVFAVAGRVASELHYVGAYPWAHGSASGSP